MTPTNVLFFLTDQHRTDTLGAYGNHVVRTPVLDAVAAEGTTFDRFYTPTAICTPARASLLSGAAPYRHQLLANYERNVGYREELADDQYTFGQDLRAAGYNVGLIGKWHVGTRRTAADYGFDGPHLHGWHNPVDAAEYEAYLAEHDLPGYAITDEIRGTFPNGTPGNLLAARLKQPVEATFEYFLAERAIAMLRRYAEEPGRPFFLATHFFGPHLPYIVPSEYFDMYDPDDVTLPASVAETFEGKPPVQANYSAHWTFDTIPEDVSRKLVAAYWGYVTLIDEQIGRVIDVARELGLYDDAAVFFSADHGEFTGAHRLHDKGPAMYEDIYRVPGVVRLPGGVPGQRSDRFATLIDLTATILDVAGLDPAKAVDGASLRPIAHGDDSGWREDLVLEFHGHHFPYPQRALVTDRYKLVVNPESVNELYDLRDDPDELHNRYTDPGHEAVRGELLANLYRQLRDRGDNFYHWMTSMYPVGGKDHDASLSSFETAGTS
ncbi:sulfatase-like hydrolase/transferase [Pseudonocardia sp. MH-G8]|uniref:sulfatase-like hydrolase/transferase n=1 Tax=Pseudonocardia sp. MH-G8 TaxID=1854588 RepID=UPI000BA0D133|nr:sulfatase-like hydrolase/transferase [Pseudonocardia sp. MH-G8]OZM77385.1 sulfatase [Pseudonocardia sp. MH-G8]